MRNFQIFSTILAIVVVIMVAQVVLSDFYPDWFSDNSKNLKTDTLNKLGADISTSENDSTTSLEYYSNETPVSDTQNTFSVKPVVAIVEEETPTTELPSVNIGELQNEQNFESQLKDFEDLDSTNTFINPYLREDQLRSAGFVTANFSEEKNDDMLFKTVFIGDSKNLIKKRFIIADSALLYAKVYVFSPDASSSADLIYEFLKEKCASGSTVSINETNQFGSSSFYMNDTLRQDIAFLTVKYDFLVYSFSYPKVYHKQVSNLIKLIGLEK